MCSQGGDFCLLCQHPESSVIHSLLVKNPTVRPGKLQPPWQLQEKRLLAPTAMSVLELIVWQVSHSVLSFNKPQYIPSNLQDHSSLLSVGLMGASKSVLSQ